VRLFVALEIPAAVRESLAALITELRDAASRVSDKRPRWVRAENLHVTLKFIGEAAPEKLDAIRGALAAVRSDSPVEMNFRGLGFFPNEKRMKVFWAGITASRNLAPLAAEIDRALSTLGIPRETREFAPHLTLARLEPPGMHEALRGAIQAAQSREFGSFQTREFLLIESKTRPTGAEYTVLQSFTFAAEA
jgi:2'-5' RNA ligase